MTIAFLIYIVSLLPGIVATSITIAVLSAIAYVILLIVIISGFGITLLRSGDTVIDPRRPMIIKAARWLVPIAIVAGIIGLFTPKEKTAWLMLGGYVMQTVYESEDGTRYRKLIMQKIDEAISDKTDDVKKKVTNE